LTLLLLLLQVFISFIYIYFGLVNVNGTVKGWSNGWVFFQLITEMNCWVLVYI
jgi:hypothetical protein